MDKMNFESEARLARLASGFNGLSPADKDLVLTFSESVLEAYNDRKDCGAVLYGTGTKPRLAGQGKATPAAGVRQGSRRLPK
jgi:hypothetical protein